MGRLVVPLCHPPMFRPLRFLPLVAALAARGLAQTPATPATPAPQKPGTPAAQPLPIAVSVDHQDAIYQQGETVTYTIRTTPDSPVAPDAEVTWSISKDGVAPIHNGKAKLENGVAKVTGQLAEPGFLLCRATVTVDGKPVAALAGAGVDPLQIKPSLPVPDDFDAFWAAQKKKLAAVPMQAKLTPVTITSKKVEAFDAQIDALGKPVSGYFARPVERKPKSLPIILTVHGAGVRSSNLNAAIHWAENGALAMDINAHGIPNGQPDTFYTDLANGALKDYRYEGRDSRETCYFLGMFLREVRALDFLCSQPEWDGRTVVVSGGSQGGFQAFAAAGIDSRVTFFAAGVPAGCDHSGMLAQRVAGWPKLVPVVDGKPDAKVLEAARYFDNVNFAARTKAKGAVVTTGFIDQTCPPTSVYAAYNALPLTTKSIYNDIPSGHASGPAASAALNAGIMAHLQAMRGQ